VEIQDDEVEKDLSMDVGEDIVDEYFDIYVEDNLKFELKNLPFFLLREMINLEGNVDQYSNKELLSLH
jgi:hypothetical protein